MSLSALSALVFVAPAKASEFACNQDPVYERSFNAKPTVGLRLRSIPCMDESEILTVMPQGTVVPVIAEMDGWYKIKYAGLVGWAGSQLMQKTDAAAVEGTVVRQENKPVNVQKIGISEYNFGRLQSGNAWLVNRLKGKIVLRVQKHGEAYYVFANGTLRYLKTLDEMRLLSPNGQAPQLKLSAKADGTSVKLVWAAVNAGAASGYKLVVSDQANPTYPEDDYQYVSDPKSVGFSWTGFEPGDVLHFRVCAYADGVCKMYSNDMPVTIANDATTNVQPAEDVAIAPQVSANGQIVLTAVLSDPGKVKLDWTVNGVDTAKGFKVVMSENANPVYPGNEYHYFTSPTVRQDYWGGLGNKVYHFRVCQYLGGACGTYSNDVAVTVTTSGAASESVMPGDIVLSATASGNGTVALSWTVNGVDVSKGFKVVNSLESNPVYPGNDYHYLSDPAVRTDTWSGFAAGKLYHFRVCQYLGGYCGTYSNDVPVTIK